MRAVGTVAVAGRRGARGVSGRRGETPLLEGDELINTTDDRTIRGALDRAVDAFGPRPWLMFEDETITFEELGTRVDRIARALVAAGVAAGDRVGLFLDNRPQWLEIEYAVASLGAWLVPLNTMYRRRETTFALDKAGISTLIWTGSVLEHDTMQVLREVVPELDAAAPGAWESERFPALQRVVGYGLGDWPSGVIAWHDLLGGASGVSSKDVRRRSVAVDPDDVALVMFTSGTTGEPKAAKIAHRSIVDLICCWADHLGLVPDDRSIMASPLFWTFGCTVNALVPLHVGSAIVLKDTFDPERFLIDIDRYGCTHLQGVPSQYQLALTHPDAETYDLSRLRVVQIGGSASAEGLARRIHARAPDARFISAYGLTEATAVATWTDPGDPLDDVIHTVGHVADGLEARVVDPGTDEDVPDGSVGELCLRGDSIMLGYLDDEQATREALRGGWLHTGDLVRRDERGYLQVIGRHVDAYKRGGMNVYPAEVETLLMEHPRIRMAAVIGVPHPDLGEVGAAHVVTDVTGIEPDEVLAYCRDQVAHYKVPSHVRIVEDLPMTPSGKVQKFVLRDAWRA